MQRRTWKRHRIAQTHTADNPQSCASDLIQQPSANLSVIPVVCIEGSRSRLDNLSVIKRASSDHQTLVSNCPHWRPSSHLFLFHSVPAATTTPRTWGYEAGFLSKQITTTRHLHPLRCQPTDRFFESVLAVSGFSTTFLVKVNSAHTAARIGER